MNNLELLKWYSDMGVDYITDNIINSNHSLNSAITEIKVEHKEIKIMAKKISNFSSSQAVIDEAKTLAESCGSVEQLKQAVMEFDGCVLKKTATNTVFADGNPTAKVMFIGEAPGATEDVEGIPFCGDSGKLLDNMLSFIGLNRSNIYITNSIFWRPPGNRKPTPEEIAICLPFVEKHIALVNPGLLILVGSTAVSAVLSSSEAMGKMRNKFHIYNNQYLQHETAVTAIFHPSYLLRQPSQKKLAWLDLLLIKKYLVENHILTK